MLAVGLDQAAMQAAAEATMGTPQLVQTAAATLQLVQIAATNGQARGIVAACCLLHLAAPRACPTGEARCRACTKRRATVVPLTCCTLLTPRAAGLKVRQFEMGFETAPCHPSIVTLSLSHDDMHWHILIIAAI